MTRVSLNPWREKRRRLAILAGVVPRLLNGVLGPLLGWHGVPFIIGMLFAAPHYRKQFARVTDDDGLREVKRTFLLVGVLYNRLRDRFGEEVAYRAAHRFIYGLGNAVQRQAYFPPAGVPRKWEWFHQEHEAQIREGFIRNNENDGILYSENQVSLHITRCRFFEAFRDMGNAKLAEAFCASDETVFNEYSPEMQFHRGSEVPNTIARGARRCTFVYNRRLQDGGQR
ncbi:L-2-amino-thiazoline-4-carboxylic acid hydrolase [Noviherbaspirillum sp. ST9]|uniref:L-2-amino-thiazoline-4-carboxylic acid hydrolase n=1 Tax=Noviherbaspirillum sp. ST9 TaxID=3401606 RepID=UPI003B58A3EC